MEFPLLTDRGVRTGEPPVRYAEGWEDYKETFAGDQSEATRVIYVPWGLRWNYIRAVLPWCETYEFPQPPPQAPGTPANLCNLAVIDRPVPDPDDPTTYVYRQAFRMGLKRHRAERHPWFNWLRAAKAEIVGGGIPTSPVGNQMVFKENSPDPAVPGELRPGLAKIVVSYVRHPYQEYGAGTSDADANVASGSELGRYVSREIKPATESFTMPGTTMQEFGPPGTAIIPEPLAKVFPKYHVTYTWHMVPFVPVSALSLMGHVTDKPKADNWPGFDVAGLPKLIGGEPRRCASDVLYLYPEVGNPYTLCSGIEVRDIKYHCLMKYPGANYIFRPSRVVVGRHAFLEAEHAGWVLVWRKLDAGDPYGGASHTRNSSHKPGYCLFNYADLDSLFRLCYLRNPPPTAP